MEPKEFVVTQRVWAQVSADYQSAESLRTLVVGPDTTVAEVMRWAASARNFLGSGDVVLTTPETYNNDYPDRARSDNDDVSPHA